MTRIDASSAGGQETRPFRHRWRVASPGKLIALVVSFAVLLTAHLAPTLPGLAPSAQTVLGVFVWFIILLASEALPQIMLGVSAPALLVLLAGIPVPKAFNAFSNDIFFLIFGAFVLVAVMIETGLGKRIALKIASLVRSARATRLMASLMAAGTVLHSVLPTVAETALFLPISRCFGELSEGQERTRAHERVNQAMILTITGLVPLFAGVFFLTAGVPNLILAGLLSKNHGIEIGWLDWLVYNIPLWGLIPIIFFLVRWWFGMRGVELPNAETVLPRVRAELGPIKRGEIWTLICLGVGFILWIGEPLFGVSTGMAALVMVTLLFLPWGGLKFADFGPKVMWGMLFLIGGAISLGNQLYKSGAVEWLAQFLVGPIQSSGMTNGILILLVLAFALHVARAGIISGGAMAAIFVPLIVGTAQQLGFNLLPFSLVLTNALNFAVFVPVSAVAVLIAVQAARIRWKEMIVFGSILSVIANVYLILVQVPWMALLGYPLSGG